MSSELAKRLRLHAGQRVLIINAPKKYMNQLGPLPDGAELVHKGHRACDFVHLFVRTADELREHGPRAIKAVKPDGVLWVSYPKKSSGSTSDLTREVSWEIMSEHGYHPVAQISIGGAWSALRFKANESGRE